MKYLKTLTVFLIILCSFCCKAQKQNNTWVFGVNCGMNFNTNPVSFFKANITSNEATASVSDRNTGKLLFYTNGLHVYDHTGIPMPNGMGIGIDTISTNAQGAVIIPHQSEKSKYYLFTIEPFTGLNLNDGILRYSLIDMSLNGGLGDVVPGQKNIELGKGYSELNTSAAGCDAVWLVSHKRGTLDFHAYKVGMNGLVITPVLSSFPANETIYSVGNLKASPDKRMLAMINSGSNVFYGKVRLFDFDVYSGKLSNYRVIDSIKRYSFYSCEFSANSQMLYAFLDSLIQYDLTQPTLQQVYSTRAKMALPEFPWSMQLGPDEKIYIAQSGINSFSVLTGAGNKYPGCSLSIVPVPTGNVKIGLPQVVRYAPVSAFSLGDDRTVCSGTPVKLVIDVPRASYLWSNGATGNTFFFTAEKDKTVYVSVTVDECTVTDTVHIKVQALDGFTLGNDTALCAGDTLHIAVADTMTGYRWSNGHTGNTIGISTAGTYWLETSYKGCTFSDTIHVDYPQQDIELGDNRTLCNGDTLVLNVTSAIAGSTCQWQDGSGRSSFTVKEAGVYHVVVKNLCGEHSDSVRIGYEECDCHPFVPSAFTPNGDGLNDGVTPILSCITSAYKFIIANRYGQIVFKSNIPADKWDGRYKGVACELGTYFYYLEITGPRNRQYRLKGDITLLR